MTQPSKTHKNDYAKTDAQLYGNDGTGWVAVAIDGDGFLSCKNKVWDASTLSFVDLQVNAAGELKVAANVTFPATQPVSLASSPLPSGAATSAKQDTLEALIETLQELVSRLSVLASWQASGAAGLRVIGVSMPSTAVTGPATGANVVAALLTQTKQLEQYSAIAVHSNINNVTGA